MSYKIFLDTNILIYAYDIDAGNKHQISNEIVKELWESNKGVLSTQVLQEFYVNITKKIIKPITPNEARNIIKTYLSWEIVVISPIFVISASEISERNCISFWDAMIIKSAKEAGVDRVLTEDLNSGQIIEGILIENPFF
jgi:predicted nucleic acid-binding protein